MKEFYEDKLITLSDGYKYVILDKTELDGKKYVLADEIIDGRLASNITLYRVEYANDVPHFIEEQDLSVVETVLVKLAC